MKGTRLIIGLDYGTTYTGMSFCEASIDGDNKENAIQIVHDWPSEHTKIGTKEKVPSEVTYQKEGLLWGSKIPPNVQRHMWTKLELEDKPVGEAARVQKETSSTALGLHKKPVDIIADYLGQVKAHVMQVFDQKYDKELWRTLPITLVATMPAVWSDKAKAHTREAIDKAGFNPAQFPGLKNIVDATEPECAAIYMMHSLRDTVYDTKFNTGDGFIVCDMGGGTIDLISYKVLKSEPTRIEEATVGSGAQCGGTFVDRAFLKWLEGRLGTPDFISIVGCRADALPRTMLNKKAARTLQYFLLGVKPGFSGTQNYTIPLPNPLSAIEDDEERGIEDGEIKITRYGSPPRGGLEADNDSEDLIKIFLESVAGVLQLLNQQYSQAKRSKKIDLKYVFLVGGFSDSPYMFKKIHEWAVAHQVKAVRPNYVWSAVVRGAVVKGLQGDKTNIVATRKNRRHYGTSVAEVFDSRKHSESDAYFDQYNGTKRANNQMEWLLKQGKDLPTSGAAHAKLSMCTSFWLNEKRESSLTLRASNNTKTPKRLDSGVFTVARVTVDLSAVADEEFEIRKSPSGKKYGSLKAAFE
ncbi:hypothetical protein E8E11_002700 [Didymella keratinophila]|nr:hypothetical protein E8E11_002700 [Didymella keratinophila]